MPGRAGTCLHGRGYSRQGKEGGGKWGNPGKAQAVQPACRAAMGCGSVGTVGLVPGYLCGCAQATAVRGVSIKSQNGPACR